MGPQDIKFLMTKTFADLGMDYLTVHFEACNHLHRTIQAIKNEGMKAGVALNPHPPVNNLIDTDKQFRAFVNDIEKKLTLN